MKHKRKSIVLTKLIDDSAADLRAMLWELCTGRTDKEHAAGKSSRWSKRFAASGKNASAPKLHFR